MHITKKILAVAAFALAPIFAVAPTQAAPALIDHAAAVTTSTVQTDGAEAHKVGFRHHRFGHRGFGFHHGFYGRRFGFRRSFRGRRFGFRRGFRGRRFGSRRGFRGGFRRGGFRGRR